MLAGKAPADTALLSYPLLATPKLDGIRCLVINGKAVSRTFKPIPNDHIRTQIEWAAKRNAFQGGEVDGEILVRNRTFNELSGDVRRVEFKPDFYFAIFDKVTPSAAGTDGGLSEPYSERMRRLAMLSLPDFCVKVLPVTLANLAELQAYEEKCVAEGYEGIMLRSLGSPYKTGRSSTNEGYLLKVKRFEDGEAVLLAVEEMMENKNVATRDAFGRTERSSHKENMVPKGTMGKLLVRGVGDAHDGVTFEIGTGFDAATRNWIWQNRKMLVAAKAIIKFKHQPSGADVKPRFPVFLGFRDKWDM